MDLFLKNLHDAFKDEIWKELGPLDPNWFEVLTSQTSVNDGYTDDKDDLCGNQESIFKTPLNKTAVDSQLFSTPKVFRHSRVVSPEAEDEQFFTAAEEKGSLTWMTQSPCLFLPSGQRVSGGKCEGVAPQSEDSFGLLNTPKKSPISDARYISESLGAQINPDISWTSSLNTPPAVPSTLILSKTDASPCPVSVTADRNVVFVRKLFPSLSKVSSVEASKDKTNSSVSRGAVSPEACGCTRSLLNQNDGVWQQAVPDAAEDEAGDENALSLFFANSSSALRKVKPDRIKRKQITQTNENECSKYVSVLQKAASNEEALSDLESDKLPCTPLVKTVDPTISQWSPLSLSEIPPGALESSILTERTQDDTSSVQFTRPLLKITDSGIAKKKRKFIYTVPALKTQDQAKESKYQKVDPSAGTSVSGQDVKPLEKAPGESECASTGRTTFQNPRKTDGEITPCSIGAKIQDFEMSQLCKDFAQDFSQVSNSGLQDKVTKDTLNNFCPSACLSAMKQAKQAKHLYESDDLSNRRQTCSIMERSMRDSGFQSGTAVITPMTASSVVVPHSENTDQSRQCAAAPFPSTTEGNDIVQVYAEAETSLQKSNERQILGDGRESESCRETKLPQQSGFKTALNKGISISSVNLERAKRLFEETESGKTLSKKIIKPDYSTNDKSILSNGSVKSQTSNPNRPAHLEETFGNVSSQLTASEQADVTELCSLLEEADTQFDFTQFKTEKVNQHVSPTQKPDRELDPDFLADIDFDDSFSSGNGKHPTSTVAPENLPSVSYDKTNGVPAKGTSQITDVSLTQSSSLKGENTPVAPSSENISEDKKCLSILEPKNLPRVEGSKTSKMDSSGALMSGMGFMTAGGNVLRVSQKCLRKARALFADLEENLTDQKSPDKQNVVSHPERICNMSSTMCKKDLKFALKTNCHIQESDQDCSSKIEEFGCSKQPILNSGETDDIKSLKMKETGTKIFPNDFHMASGSVISVSAKCMEQADAVFKDCNVMDLEDDMSDKRSSKAGSVCEKKNSKYKHLQVSNSDKYVTECSNLETVGLIAHHTNEPHVDEVGTSSNGSHAFKNFASLQGNPFTTSEPCSTLCTSESIDSSATDGLDTGDGFCTAKGKKVFVSADAVTKAECFFKCTHTPENINIQPDQRENASSTFVCTDEDLKAKTPGFQTASGKEVSVSSAALKKAQTWFKEYERGEDEFKVSLPHLKTYFTSPPILSGGFSAASGKPVVLSSEALQKAKEIFSNVSLDTPAVSNTIRSKEKVKYAEHDATKVDCGFTTAGGTKVNVLQKNLLKAKELFQKCDDLVLTKAMQEEDAFFKDCDVDGSNEMLVEDNQDEGKLGKPCPAQRMIENNPTEQKQGSTKSSNKQLREKEDVLLRQNVGFQTAGGKRVSISSEALKKAKSFFSDCDRVENKMTPPAKVNSLPFRKGGFLSASGKPVTVSSEALQKAKSLFSDISSNTEIQDTPQTLKQDTSNNSEKIHCGFTTAGGAKVHVSQKSLTKAKTFLQEFDHSALLEAMQGEDGGEEDTSITTDSNGKILSEHTKKAHAGESDNLKENFSKPKPDGNTRKNMSEEPGNTVNQCKQKENTLLPQDDGFQTAVVTSEALTRAEILLGENEGDHKTHVSLPFSKLWNCGFSAASGKHVTFSSDALQKAKAFFSDISLSTNISTSPDTKRSDEKHKNNQSNSEKIHYGFTTAGGGKVQVSEKSLIKAKSLLREFDEGVCQHLPLSEAKDVERTVNASTASNVDFPVKRKDSSEGKTFPLTSGVKNLNDISEEEELGMLGWDINQTCYGKRSEVGTTDESLNLIGCTESQFKLIAQEALDCTKALLEDEGLTNQNLSQDATLPGDPRKRLVEDSDVTNHPPSKRRLLEEFDRTINSPKGSNLHPVKSFGLTKDRGVFRYSAFLHPNVTKPHRAAKNNIDTSFQKTTLPQHTTPGNDRAAFSKMPVFVPPFIKNAKGEMSMNPEPKQNTRTSVFVPPFKKQRTVLQKSSSKQPGEDKCHIPSPSNTYVPPSKNSLKVKNSSDSSSHENKNLKTDESAAVNCETVHSGAEGDGGNGYFRNQDKHQNIELARDMQDMRIRKKKRQTIRPLPGSLFLKKTSGVARIPLKVAVNGKSPATFTSEQLYEHGVQKHVSEITSETAEAFRFNLWQFIKQEMLIDRGGVQLADGGWLIPSNDQTAGKEEFYRALCDTPGVDPKLISEAWVYNHYRWIVWKLVSMEKSFPEIMGSRCVTPEQVLLQLKYRYDVEVDHSRRPALRRIMEKDDTAAKTLILCVCEIVSRGFSPIRQRRSDTKTPQSADAKTETPCAVVWLTDGWYAIKAQLDEPLTAMLHKGLLTVGGKLIIHGAQLIGSQDACSPLEAPGSLMLKICANSSRRARWDAKLGFHKDPRPFLLPISSLYGNGGPVGCVDIIILRSYPIQWMERKADGSVVFRSGRAEEKEARRYNSHKHKSMEMLFAKIQADFEKEEQAKRKPQQKRKSVSRHSIATLQDGEELYEAVGDDLAYLEAHLSEQQLETLHAYRRLQMEKKQAELQDRYRRALEAEDNEVSCPKRDVTPVWKLCIADSQAPPSCVYQLNLWRPSSDLQSLLKEGCRYKVYNLVASDGKKRSYTETVQLTGTKKTQFQDLQASRDWLSDHFQPRVSTNFVNLQNAEFQPLCGEVDLTGYVISVVDEQGSSPAFYLADGKLNFVKVRCFSSFSQGGLEDVVKPGVLLALSNLQLRGQSIHPTPVVYAGDLTVFSTNPKEGHLQESLSQLRNVVQCEDNFFQNAKEKFLLLVKSDATSSISSPWLQPQTPVAGIDTNPNMTVQKSIRGFGSSTPLSRNPPAATSSEKDPRSLKRKRALDYLSRIPSPPPLSHLGAVVSPCVKKTFNPPRRSGTPDTLKPAQTSLQKHTESLAENEWVNDEELAMIDTQALCVGD